jgi:hypothetical protein
MHQEPSGVWIMAYTTIDNPFKYFNTITWTGDGASTRSITGVGFQPDWIWLKCRSTGHDHYSWDSVRTNKKGLEPSDTSAERTPTLGSIDSDGFSFASLDSFYNANSDTYVGWNWRAGNSSGSSNSDGSITSTVSVNQTAGFSVVSYTGTGSNATVGHGLGATMDFAILRRYTQTSSWLVYHKSLGATKAIYLNETGAVGTNSSGFNDTAPTSSVFTIGNGATGNTSSADHIAYCFAEKKGYSKFGSYTGNGNADGTFVYTGFRPAWIMRKSTSRTNEWTLIDSTRSSFNQTNETLVPNAADVEDGDFDIDILSNGFKCRTSESAHNQSGDNFIYMAFAEAPFVTAGTKAAGTAR